MTCDIVAKLIEVYNRFGIEDKNSGDKNALKFIDERIDKLRENSLATLYILRRIRGKILHRSIANIVAGRDSRNE